jgi:hypothetical protein
MALNSAKKSQIIVRATRVSLVATLCVSVSTVMFLTPVRCQNKEDNQPYVSNVRQIKSAGFQFEKPKPWTDSANKAWTDPADKGGTTVLLIEDGIVSVTFVVVEKYEELIAGIKSGLSEGNTEVWTDGERTQNIHNGMKHIRESGYVVRKGVRVTWIIDVYESRKNVVMFTFGRQTTFQAHRDEYVIFLNSITNSLAESPPPP